MLRTGSYFIIIAGCGRMGAYLANKLSKAGHSVVVVDVKSAAFDLLSEEFSGFKVEGDATEFAVLKEAKAEKADILIATARRDNVNLMVAQVAKKIFGIPEVIARVIETERENIYKELEVKTVCPTRIAGDSFFALVNDFINKSEEKDVK